MLTLYIRDFPEDIYQKIKKRAKLHRRSISQEAVTIIEEVLNRPKKELELWDEIDLIKERIYARYGSFGDSAPLIREDRQR